MEKAKLKIEIFHVSETEKGFDTRLEYHQSGDIYELCYGISQLMQSKREIKDTIIRAIGLYLESRNLPESEYLNLIEKLLKD